ncbi:helix-turn-helix transcriptional regulator [Actinoplanes sp. NPDC000266]
METPKLGPIRADRLLRADLRRAREAVELSQAELAQVLSWSVSKVARIENGGVGISGDDLRALAKALGLGSAVIRELEKRADSAHQRGWWHGRRNQLSEALATLLGLEMEADRIGQYACELMPDLLQTESYAEVALLGMHVDPEYEQTIWNPEAGRPVPVPLDLLLQRQRWFWERSDPPEFQVVIDEAVLYRRVGAPEVMAEQVRRLAEAARRPQVELRVLPIESRVVRKHGFVVVSDEMIGHLVYTDLLNGDWLWEGGVLATGLADHFDGLRAVSLDADRTGQLLHRVAEVYAAGDEPRPWLWQ